MKFTDLKEEALLLWSNGEYESHMKLAEYLYEKYDLVGNVDYSRRTLSNWIRYEEPVEQYIPKILILDIETAPILANVWGLWKQNVGLNQIDRDWYMLCYSCKWLYSDEVLSGKLNKEEMMNHDDKRITEELWVLLDEAELVVAHNGQRFDIPKINTRFLIHGLKRPSPYKIIDTLLLVRKQFGFSSNKLDALAGYLGFDHKLDTDFTLWSRCIKGDVEAMEYMSKYCDRDILLLEEVYLELRPWMPNHPNIGLYFDETKQMCPNCGSTDIKDEKPYYTSVSRFPTYRCNSCGAISRGKKSDNDNKKLLRSV